MTARLDTAPALTEPPASTVDAGTRSQIAEFLRMTPSERLASLVSAVEFIEAGRAAISRSHG